MNVELETTEVWPPPLFESERELPTLQRHNTENSKQIFPEKELRGQIPNSYIHASVSSSYIPTSRSAYSAAGK